MSRKRDKPYLTRHDRVPLFKRRRPLPPSISNPEEHDSSSKPTPPAAVVVMGLSLNSSVLDLKSRFEIYGAISRIRIDGDGVGCINFRSKDSAEAAIAASLDSSFGITIDSKKVQVLWSTDPLVQWREGVTSSSNKEIRRLSSSSKLLRSETPLRRHRRSNKLDSTIVNTKSIDPAPVSDGVETSILPESRFNGREIIAYDDIL